MADDHPLLLAGLAHELARAGTIRLVGTARNSTELVALLETDPCDVVVSDYAMPGGEFGDGIALFSFIRRRFPAIRLVVLTMLDNPGVIRTLLANDISCILSKSDATDHLIAAIYAVLANGRYFSPTTAAIIQTITPAGALTHDLSPRETEVVRLYASGMTINEIAERLHRSKQTVSTQKSSAMRKLGITRDPDLVKYAVEAGLVTLTGTSSS
nr:response regulator transcription factor [Burkholderia territorii]